MESDCFVHALCNRKACVCRSEWWQGNLGLLQTIRWCDDEGKENLLMAPHVAIASNCTNVYRSHHRTAGAALAHSLSSLPCRKHKHTCIRMHSDAIHISALQLGDVSFIYTFPEDHQYQNKASLCQAVMYCLLLMFIVITCNSGLPAAPASNKWPSELTISSNIRCVYICRLPVLPTQRCCTLL